MMDVARPALALCLVLAAPMAAAQPALPDDAPGADVLPDPVIPSPAPDQPDNVVQRLGQGDTALFAVQDYLDRHGHPDLDGDLSAHWFVGADDAESRAPYYQWLSAHVPRERVVFRATDARVAKYAILQGVGLGFVPVQEAAHHPELVQVCAPRPDWAAPLWVVTHVDLHRTAKVQALVRHLKEEARAWTAPQSPAAG
jgi:DNA-binding transcriptional LysR family regulator